MEIILFSIFMVVVIYFAFIRKRTKLKKLAISLFFLVIACFIILYAVSLLLKFYTKHGEKVTVPNVVNLSFEEAQDTLLSQKLGIIVKDTTYSATMTRGNILWQLPDSGHVVKSGRGIFVTIATDVLPTVSMPNLVNSPLREAIEKIKHANLEVKIEYTSGYKDYVYEQKIGNDKISSGTQVPIRSLITLVVGEGEAEISDTTESLTEEE